MANEFTKEDSLNLGEIYYENKGSYNEAVDEKFNNFCLPLEEYSDICVKCQKRHYKTKGFNKDGSFPIECKGIPKALSDEGYYPLDLIFGEDYKRLSMEEKIMLQYKNNVLLWARDMLGWTTFNPKRKFRQYYQDEMLLCTARWKAGRLGRRMGKSEVLVIDVLHYGMTTFVKNPHILIIAPFNNLCDELHQRIISKLDDSVYGNTYSSTKKPYTITIPRPQFGDNCVIKLFTTGSGSGNAGASTRGQAADKLVIDECGYTDQESLEAVLPLVLEHNEVQLTVTSTPSQMPNKFKEWCLEDKEWKDFYYPFTIMPGFGPGNKEYEQFKKMYTVKGWKQEIDAEFYEGNSKVFKSEDIKNAIKEYKYAEDIFSIPKDEREDWTFVIGVDWNAAKHGVQILLLGINLNNRKVKVWKRVSVSNEERGLQLKAVDEIIKMDRAFGAEKIIVDMGYGAVQVEILLKHYQRFSQEEKVVAVDFASTITQEHPLTKEKFAKRIKCVMVAMLQQRFEYGTIDLSYEDGTIPSTEDREGKYLATQLDNYEIEKYDNRDNPVFKASGPGTDHALDALLLANYGINRFVEEVFELGIGHRASMGVSSLEEETVQSINNFLNNTTEKLAHKFSNSGFRENFTDAYSGLAFDEEKNNRYDIANKGGLNKIFGTSKKRLTRRSF